MIFPAKRVTQVVDVISTPSCFKFRELAVMKQLIFKVTPATDECTTPVSRTSINATLACHILYYLLPRHLRPKEFFFTFSQTKSRP